jgi:adenine-specific DNA-methyltransferase
LSVLREPRSDKTRDIYSNPDNDSRGNWTSSSYVNPATKNERPNLVYTIENPTTGEKIEHPTHAWKYEYSEHLRHVKENRLWWGQAGDAKFPRLKNFLGEMPEGVVPIDVWTYEETGTTDDGGNEVKALFGSAIFDNPKPTKLIRRILGLISSANKDAIILDFFGGSGSTADAVLQSNAALGRKDRFIIVQLPEKSDKAGYETIAEITKERIRRAGAKIKAENATTAPNLDIGFRVLKIDTSNMEDVYYAPDSVKQSDLVTHEDNIKMGRTPEDLLFQVLVDWGVDLSLPITQEVMAGRGVFFVDGNALAACFDASISEELVKEMARRKPLRAVFRDSSYGGDSVKINVEQIFKLLSPATELRSL